MNKILTLRSRLHGLRDKTGDMVTRDRSRAWRHASAAQERIALVAVVAMVAGLLVGGLPAGEAEASHGNSWQLSQGTYRIPYATNTEVRVTQDHHTHGGEGGNKDRIDMTAGKGAVVVASAGGWIRGIVDKHGNSPNPGDGRDKNGTAVDGHDELEHACQDERDEDGKRIEDSVVTGFCQDYNNYVWVEHPNGEWTKYSHLGTGTASLPLPFGQGLKIGDWIDVGQAIGLENDIGSADGSHLHYEVAVPNDPTDPTPFSTNGGFISGVNRVPRVCDIEDNIYKRFADTGQLYTAAPCEHQPPVANAGGPYSTAEGTPIQLDATASFDPEGRPLSYRWEPAGLFVDPTVAEPTFLSGDNMIAFVEVTVYDQVEALTDSDTAMVVVSNVPPTVTISQTQVTEIDEGGFVTVVAEFTDPGFDDTHTATIDWGVPAGHAGVQLIPTTVQILDEGGPGPRRGRVTGTYLYGDNDAGAGYVVNVTVTDDDGGWHNDGFHLTVNNVDPTVEIDLTGATLLGGVPTFLSQVGQVLLLESHTTDPGSDDLTFVWDWGDGTLFSRTSLVNPPASDPAPSPTVQPRSERDRSQHAFEEACLYEVEHSVTDDDDGRSSATVHVLAVGTADGARGAGYWRNEYRGKNKPDFTPEALQCLLDIVNHASSVFSEERPLASFDEAVDVLWPKGKKTADDQLDRQLLAGWLNYANGVFDLEVLLDAETVRLDPDRTNQEVLAMKDLLEGLNS